jgi:hypothetical protein
MASTAPLPPPSFWRRGDQEVSRARLYLLRATCILFFLAGPFIALPDVIHPEPNVRGVMSSLVASVWRHYFRPALWGAA